MTRAYPPPSHYLPTYHIEHEHEHGHGQHGRHGHGQPYQAGRAAGVLGVGAKGRSLAEHQRPVSKKWETGQGADARGRVPIISPVLLIILIILHNLVMDTRDTRIRGYIKKNHFIP